MMVPIEKLVSQETVQKFNTYEHILRKWNRRTALVQEDTLPDFNNRHLIDSLQLIPIIEAIPSLISLPINREIDQETFSLANFEPFREGWKKLDGQSHIKNTLSLIDIGSGAGFPGMVLAISGFRKMSLCESNQKKCFFLEEVARQTNTDVKIIKDRIENVTEKFDIFLSRACTDLEKLLEIMMLRSSDDSLSYGLFHKGRSWKEEVALAQKKWSFSGSFSKSVTSNDGVILCLHHLKRRETSQRLLD